MCQKSGQFCCQQPDKCKGHPSQCTPEQIRECHGDVAEHPCEGEAPTQPVTDSTGI